jgi:hypothetical protein
MQSHGALLAFIPCVANSNPRFRGRIIEVISVPCGSSRTPRCRLLVTPGLLVNVELIGREITHQPTCRLKRKTNPPKTALRYSEVKHRNRQTKKMKKPRPGGAGSAITLFAYAASSPGRRGSKPCIGICILAIKIPRKAL